MAFQSWQKEGPLPEPCPQNDAVLPGDHLAAAGEDPPPLLILSQPLPPRPRMRHPALCLQPPPAWPLTKHVSSTIPCQLALLQLDTGSTRRQVHSWADGRSFQMMQCTEHCAAIADDALLL